MKVKNGDKIKVRYTGTLDDGKVFDSNEGKDLLEFEVGKSMVIKGFDEAVVDMEVGEEKEVKIEAKNAYGEPNKDLLHKVPRKQLEENNIKLEKGATLALQAPTGQVFNALIVDLTDTEVSLDLNHPLAGKNLNFKIKVEEIGN
tara:strand:- start:408 stop:839 length:432 start_codon:yes stop_codon:yes gene_type:complete